MTENEKEIIVIFLRNVRRHAIGQVAACDKLLAALGVSHGDSPITTTDTAQIDGTESTTPTPNFR
jgi:hypothetical protein